MMNLAHKREHTMARMLLACSKQNWLKQSVQWGNHMHAFNCSAPLAKILCTKFAVTVRRDLTNPNSYSIFWLSKFHTSRMWYVVQNLSIKELPIIHRKLIFSFMFQFFPGFSFLIHFFFFILLFRYNPAHNFDFVSCVARI